MSRNSEHNYWNWSIEKGDYKRDEHSTWSYQKKIIRKRRIRTVLMVLLYLAVISFAAFMFFGT